MPEILQWQRERLVAKLEDAEVQLENNALSKSYADGEAYRRCRRTDRPEAHVKERP